MSHACSMTLALAGGTAPLVSAWLIDTPSLEPQPAYRIEQPGVAAVAPMRPMEETNAIAIDP